jgi:predicted regulator of Ras-like GTPase activity (Roadblock/LC7/MglB family)
MASRRLFARSAIAVIATAIAAKAGAVVFSKEASSVADRVAAIRAKAAALAGVQSDETTAGRPAQVAWNDWKNE